ncbi:MAG: hypothetical protein KDE56_33715, partial [Anaerolineales bacterium]|nr:hypothetical protein [Anaerolineales bacterium]
MVKLPGQLLHMPLGALVSVGVLLAGSAAKKPGSLEKPGLLLVISVPLFRPINERTKALSKVLLTFVIPTSLRGGIF